MDYINVTNDTFNSEATFIGKVSYMVHWLNNSQVHNWQKWKSTFLSCHCHEIYRVEAIGLKSSNYTLKNYDFCEYVKFVAISLKIDIL